MNKFLRPVPHFKGKFWLTRLFFKRKLKTAKDVIVNGKYGLQYYLPNLRENIAFEIFANGIYEQQTSNLIISKLPAGGVFLDIGANIGSITMPVCKIRPDVKAICVEASTKVFTNLVKNIAINKIENCILLNKAVSFADNEEVVFYSPDELFGKGSVVTEFSDFTEKVKTITIDTLIHDLKVFNIHFIKIDIEGYEYYAFEGAKQTLMQPNAPDILFEFLDYAESANSSLKVGDAQKFLLDCGYRLYKVSENNKLEKIAGFLNEGEEMLFATKKNAE